jgi:hypothetical protein
MPNPNCNRRLIEAKMPYFRSCKVCGLGKCTDADEPVDLADQNARLKATLKTLADAANEMAWTANLGMADKAIADANKLLEELNK